ncbi:MAG: DUF4112 domain-containing protein, partial [Potamolinea sp.]
MSQPHRQHSHQPNATHTSTLKRLRRLSNLLDNAIPIPGTSYRIGIDPILDLLPIGGDFIGTVFSVYIVLEAVKLGLPRAALVQMVWNIVLDTVIGAVPALGTVVDAVWKANVKNILLLEEHLNVPHPQPGKKVDWLFLAMLLGGLLLVVFIIAVFSAMFVKW